MNETRALFELLQAVYRGQSPNLDCVEVTAHNPSSKTAQLLHQLNHQRYVTSSGSGDFELTPRGRDEYVRLLYYDTKNALPWYRDVRRRLLKNLSRLVDEGARRIIFYGAGDVAEVAYAVVEDLPLKLLAVVDDFRVGEGFFSLNISPVGTLLHEDFDRVVITSFRSSEAMRQHIIHLGIPEESVEELQE